MQGLFSVPIYSASITLISSSLYGLFFVLSVLSILVLNRQCKKGTGLLTSSTNVYLASSYMMFIVLTTVWIISATMSFNPNLIRQPHSPSDYPPLMFAQNITGYFANLIGDFVMIYRLYIIWDRNKLVIWTGGILGFISLGIAIGMVAYFAQTKSAPPVPDIVLAGISISTNILATSLIARTVWKRTELARAVGGGKVIYRLIAIFIESSALYTLWMLSFIVTFFTVNSVSEVFLYGSPHIAGIASMLINVRVGLGWAVGEEGRSVHSFHDSVLADHPPSHRDSVDV